MFSFTSLSFQRLMSLTQNLGNNGLIGDTGPNVVCTSSNLGSDTKTFMLGMSQNIDPRYKVCSGSIFLIDPMNLFESEEKMQQLRDFFERKCNKTFG